jgi:hypothetical protein
MDKEYEKAYLGELQSINIGIARTNALLKELIKVIKNANI